MRVALLPALLALLVLSPVTADHCVSWSTTVPDVACGDVAYPGDHPYYVDEDCCGMCLYSIWVYEESNGLPGLQREDEIVDDTCHGMIRGDTIVL